MQLIHLFDFQVDFITRIVNHVIDVNVMLFIDRTNFWFFFVVVVVFDKQFFLCSMLFGLT